MIFDMSLALPSKVALALSAAALFCSANTQAAVQSNIFNSPSSREADALVHAKVHAKYVVLASELKGKKVVGSEGIRIGELRDVVLNLTTGKIRYALLEFEPSFFSAEKFYAFPVQTLSLGGTKHTVFYEHPASLLLDKVQASKSPTVSQDSYPDQLPGMFRQSRHVPPLANGISIRCSRLIGRHVRGSDGLELGTIADLGLDMSQSRLLFVVITSGQKEVVDREMKLLPAADLLMFDDTRDLSTSIDSVSIKSSKNFASVRWDSLDDEGRRLLTPDTKPLRPARN